MRWRRAPPPPFGTQRLVKVSGEVAGRATLEDGKRIENPEVASAPDEAPSHPPGRVLPGRKQSWMPRLATDLAAASLTDRVAARPRGISAFDPPRSKARAQGRSLLDAFSWGAEKMRG